MLDLGLVGWIVVGFIAVFGALVVRLGLNAIDQG